MSRSQTHEYGCDLNFDTTTRPLSRMYIGRALYHVFATILRERKLLPDSAFKTVALKNNKSYRFRALDPTNATGRRTLEKFIGVQKAIDDGYFRELILVVSENDDDSDDAIEIFSWKVSYSEDGNLSAIFGDGAEKVFACLRFHGDKYIEDKTKLMTLLAKDICRKRLSPLPSAAYATFRITYTAETPHGYQADGFQRTDSLYNLHESAQSVNMGFLATPTEKFLLSVNSCFLSETDRLDAQKVIDAKFDDRAEDLSFENMRLNTSVNDDAEATKFVNSTLLSPIRPELEPLNVTPVESEKDAQLRTPDRISQKRKSQRLGYASGGETAAAADMSTPRKRFSPQRDIKMNPSSKSPSFTSNTIEGDPLFARIKRDHDGRRGR